MGKTQVCSSLTDDLLFVSYDPRQSSAGSQCTEQHILLKRITCAGYPLPAGAVARLRRRAGDASCTTLNLSHSLQGEPQVAAVQVHIPRTLPQSVV